MQINRLFEMIYILLNKESMTAKAFAEYFEVSPRTIYRDVELLSGAGIPIYMTKGKGGGISLLPDFVLNKTVLTDVEKADILSALKAVEAVSLEQVSTAVGKLSSMFGGAGSDWLEVDFSDWANGEEEAAVFSMLKTAILEKKKVEFLYHGGQKKDKLVINNNESCEYRIVEPLKLCFKGQSWYLYAYCTLRNDFRFFKLRRMKEVRRLEDEFQRIAPLKLFDGSKLFEDKFVTITLKLSKDMAYRVYDEFSQYEILADGSFRVQLSMPKGEWVYHYLATFGEHCEILAPADIRLEIKEKLQKTLKQYL